MKERGRDAGTPVRVAHIVTGLGPGGLERMVRDLALALPSRGHVPAVFCTAKLGLHAEDLQRAGIETVLCGGEGRHLPGVLVRLVRDLRRFRPDILHAHSGAWPAAALARGLVQPAPLIYTVHGRPANRGWRLRLERFCSRRTDRVTAVSSALADEAEGTFGLPVLTLPNGVDLVARKDPASAARLRASCGIAPGDILAVAVGRLEPVKDHSLLLRALALALPAAPALRLAILGTGSLEQPLREEARSLGIAARVSFLGFRNDAARWMEAADLFAMPSRDEGLPLALLEAMACELPIVAAAIPGLEEALGDPPAGMLVRRGDPAAFAEALSGLAGDPARRKQLAGRALERSRQFPFSTMVDRYCALYDEMLP